MLSKKKLETLFDNDIQSARRRRDAGDFENAIRRAAFALGLATALDCNDRKTIAAELLSDLTLRQPREG